MAENTKASNRKRLATLEEELAQLSHLLPEHCSGKEKYLDVHHASIELWQKIEDLEEEIKTLKAALAQ